MKWGSRKMKAEADQPILSDEGNPKDTDTPITSQRMAYKAVLAAIVIGLVTIIALWVFTILQKENPGHVAMMTEPHSQVEEESEEKGVELARIADQYDQVDRKLVFLSDRIERGFEGQLNHSSEVREGYSVLADRIQAIDLAIAKLGDSHTERDRRIGETTTRLDIIANEVKVLQDVKRQPAIPHKPTPVEPPPFELEAIDIWDDVTYVAVSKSGRTTFLKTGEQQSSWTVMRIDHRQGKVDFKGPAGQIHSASLPR